MTREGTHVRKVLAVFSDIHCGHKFGLMPPDMQLLDDSGPEPRTWTPPSTGIQDWLWGHYQADSARVWELAGRAPVTVVLDGDVTWGARFPTQLVSTRMADQLTIALACLEPWYQHKGLASVVLVQGTESHEWGEGSAPILIAAELQRRYPKVRTVCTRHTLLDAAGLRLDVAHHGPGPGQRAWLKGNVLRAYARSVIMDDLLAGRKPPDVIVRAHYHTAVRETLHEYGHDCEAVILPSYCGMTHFAVQATRSAYMLGCGMLALEVADGRLARLHELWRSLDLRQEEAV